MAELGETTLESLRAEGADARDPVRFCYLEALAARLPAQPPAVQQVLAQRLQRAIAAYSAAAATPLNVVTMACTPHAIPSPLAQLNRDLQARAQAEADQLRIDGGTSASDMKSVRQFSEVWSQIAAGQQVEQALHRGPDNAGPLNPHKLMLRSLGLMRSLSPDYLRRFLSQMDSLLWLEQVSSRPQRSPLKPGRAARVRS